MEELKYPPSLMDMEYDKDFPIMVRSLRYCAAVVTRTTSAFDWAREGCGGALFVATVGQGQGDDVLKSVDAGV